MNENRSSNTLRCSRSISNGRNSDIGDRLLAMVRLANTRLWTNGLRSARLSPDSRSLEANATGSLWSSADGNSPTDGDARGHYRGEPAGLPAAVFRNYLLADTAYVGLLITQGLIMAITIGTWALPHLHGHWLASLKIFRK